LKEFGLQPTGLGPSLEENEAIAFPDKEKQDLTDTLSAKIKIALHGHSASTVSEPENVRVSAGSDPLAGASAVQ